MELDGTIREILTIYRCMFWLYLKIHGALAGVELFCGAREKSDCTRSCTPPCRSRPNSLSLCDPPLHLRNAVFLSSRPVRVQSSRTLLTHTLPRPEVVPSVFLRFCELAQCQAFA